MCMTAMQKRRLTETGEEVLRATGRLPLCQGLHSSAFIGRNKLLFFPGWFYSDPISLLETLFSKRRKSKCESGPHFLSGPRGVVFCPSPPRLKLGMSQDQLGSCSTKLFPASFSTHFLSQGSPQRLHTMTGSQQGLPQEITNPAIQKEVSGLPFFHPPSSFLFNPQTLLGNRLQEPCLSNPEKSLSFQPLSLVFFTLRLVFFFFTHPPGFFFHPRPGSN